MPAELPAVLPPRTWVLLGQKAGDNNQVLALADALGWPCESRSIENHAWELLVGRRKGGTLAGIKRAASSPLEPPWPELVISAGRRNEPVAQWLRQTNAGRTRLVHMGRPWAPLECFDLVVTTPQYFLPQQANILYNQLPLHRITPQQVAVDAAALAGRLDLARPYTAVLLGGDSGPFVFTPAKARRMGEQVNEQVLASGGSVLVCDSRRTPAAAFDAFCAALTVPVYAHSWRTGAGDNPYRGLLGLADDFVVTGESMSMLAEAAAMAKPLAIFDLSDSGKAWWQWPHNYRIKPLSHRLAMRLGPLRMRRDIGNIQRQLVDAGRANWLGGRKAAGETGIVGMDEASHTAQAVRRLFT